MGEGGRDGVGKWRKEGFGVLHGREVGIEGLRIGNWFGMKNLVGADGESRWSS